MKNTIYILILIAAVSCTKESKNDCIDESKKGTRIFCAFDVPVCGCNDVTYADACTASLAGVISWTEGPCQ